MKRIERVAPSDHVVLFYDDDADLRQSAGAYLGEALLAGNVAVVIASQPHLEMFAHELTAAGLDLARLGVEGSWIALDAAETLHQMLRDGRLDADAFDSVVGNLFARAAELGRPICAYGEMVDLLWRARQINTALALEELWNALGERTPFSLFCSYSPASLSDPTLANEIEIVSSHHSRIVEASRELGSPATRRSVQAFPATLDAVTQARHFATAVISDWGYDDVVQDLQLIVSELASNAIRHAHSAFTVVLSGSDSSLRVAVFDASHALAIPRRPENSSSSGRGLMLVAALATEWGVAQTDDGKVVWAQVQP